jgi:curli biogenesis system outer membrane secretion channel CsgG
MKKQVLKIVEFKTGEVIKVIDVTGRSDSSVERVMRGILINMNTDEYYIDDDEAFNAD